MTVVRAGWWMEPPQGWEPVHRIFDLLAKLLPFEIVHRFDFARGGE